MSTDTRRERMQSYVLEGMDCASCAQRIEDALRREPGLEEATVSFATGSVLLPPERVERAREIIARVEPGVRLVPPRQDTGAAARNGTLQESVLPHGPHPAPGAAAHPAGEAVARATGEAVAPGSSAKERTGATGQAERPAEEEERHSTYRRLAAIGLATLAFLAATFLHPRLEGTSLALAVDAALLAVYVWVGHGVIGAALRNARRGQFFDENFLMTLATAGAIAIHELPEAVAVMLFYTVGEFFQDLAVQRSRRSIRALMDLRPDYAHVRRNGEILRVPPEAVAVGEEIVVRPGERIPLDGEVVEGSSFADTSALTGESVPRRVEPGDEVMAGMVNTRGLLTVRVSRPFGESSVAKILRLVETAAARKAPTERFITTFSRYYTPAVVAAALAVAVIPPLVVPGAAFGDWLRRALVLLVISCPCALVISIPLGYFGGLGGASRRGVLVKGSNYLDALTRLDTVVWDKTGTLTRGVFKVVEVTPFNGFSRDRVLELAAHAEAFSSHPIAASIAEAYGRAVERSRVAGYEEVAGHGVRARVDGQLVVAGNDRLLHREDIPHETCEAEGTVVYVAVDGVLAGRIVIADEIKPEAAAAVRALRELGVRRQVMLTGDDRSVAEKVAAALGLDEVRANLLPEDKVEAVERLDAERRREGRIGALAFVGDGINDAPVLTRADIGVAMGGLGSDAAIEAADVVIMDDSPARLATAVSVARATRRIVKQNIAFALGVKLIFVLLGAAGVASMWEAVFADVGVSLLAILNATRVLRAG
ncbi:MULTISPECIES: heavy metal translocating P-type ATPase [Thermaerobacter]|uniref:Cd(2+)-exporting ATPase n=1 Tax=Thermaerobacter composti TaxID=554949 RepID=A0ABZ0QMW6_9FIRM|nr:MULTISPECIES: heavy metal translocating P-type ATPase [Thermaerobacter]PZN07441.1 MAG: cadmium-translocating P-type ATPase [Bacillota bacterium]QBS36853.1 cadmium-translocating P-type ATPase [Thermaerobacter sp. FW80]WPD18837.1 heavy metal translocating P-type ATPase [Thermaerobacter composti]